MSATAVEPVDCPRCQTQVTNDQNRRWCPRCGWNLHRYDLRRLGFGGGWLGHLWYSATLRLNGRQFAAALRAEPDRVPRGVARSLLVVTAVATYAWVVGAFCVGVLMIVMPSQPGHPPVGIALVLFAILMRPRFNRLRPAPEPIASEEAPALFALINRVAAALGAPLPHEVALTDYFGGALATVGDRGRRVLIIGLPLWASLPPGQRVAFLATLLGRFAFRDVRQTRAWHLVGWLRQLPAMPSDPGLWAKTRYWFGVLLVAVHYSLVATFALVPFTVHVGLRWAAARDALRAAYAADDRTILVAGSAAARDLLDSVVTREEAVAAVAGAAAACADPSAWRAAAEERRRSLAADLPTRHQLSVADDVSFFAWHPPIGLRRRLVEVRPWRNPQVVLTEQESDRIDAELARHYGRVRPTVAACGDASLPT